MSDRHDRSPTRFLVPALAALLLAGVVVMPLISASIRWWNFAAFGAIALFIAARSGRYSLWLALGLVLSTKLLSDGLNYMKMSYDPQYLPFADLGQTFAVYGGFACYALIGWALLRRTEKPLAVGGATLLASVSFFLITNFASWLGQALPYPLTLSGLMECYWMGLPFYRGTFISDLVFSGVLFGLHAILVRVPDLYAKPVSVEVNTDEREGSR